MLNYELTKLNVAYSALLYMPPLEFVSTLWKKVGKVIFDRRSKNVSRKIKLVID